ISNSDNMLGLPHVASRSILHALIGEAFAEVEDLQLKFQHGPAALPLAVSSEIMRDVSGSGIWKCKSSSFALLSDADVSRPGPASVSKEMDFLVEL
ncbi:UNVERIFIED_CONTAM: hypothetical protein NY603_21005, partial [Bacteroidetes bacterium 56_B9]